MKTPIKHNNPKTLTTALEKAAKHICTARSGLCPHMVEQYPCPSDCTLDTTAWECWAQYFLDQATPARPQNNTG